VPELQVLEDLLADGRILDDRQQPHGAATARADQDVLGVRSLHQIRPHETAGAVWIVGTSEVVSVRCQRLLLRISSLCFTGTSSGPTTASCTYGDWRQASCTDPCSVYPYLLDCENCLLGTSAYFGCGWCASDSTCRAGRSSGADDVMCTGASWLFSSCE
jgi:hypothetical protein